MLSTASIVVGYIALIALTGWVGVAAVAIHVGILLLAVRK